MCYSIFCWSFLLIFVAACNGMAPSKPKEMEPCTEANILKRFDNSLEGYYNEFIYLDHGYFELANCRLTLFKDGDQWAMVFEKFGYNARAGETVQIETTSFGNCLIDLQLFNGQPTNIEFIGVDNDIYEVLQQNRDTITIRTLKIRIPNDFAPYQKYGIEWDFEGNNYEGAVLKYLAETQPDATRATDDEVRRHIPKNLKKIMTIDSWYHQEFNGAFPTHRPSTQKTYQMIAKVLATGDTSYYKPIEEPNTHWSNYPESGGL